MYDFTDKVIMITGASGNLGSALAHRFHAAGGRLGLVDMNRDLLEKAFPDLIDDPACLLTTGGDLTNKDDAQDILQQILSQFGQIDVLVNTVGGYRAGTPLHETPLSTLDFMMKLNASTVFITNQVVLPHMIDRGFGKIVNIAARPGLQGQADMAAYSASKAAVMRLTESASQEVREYGVNVNCILPGTIDTPQNRAANPQANPDHWVKPESLADVILFLASEAARDVHGAAIPVYGLT